MRIQFFVLLLIGVTFVSAGFADPPAENQCDEEEERLVREMERIITYGERSRTLAKFCDRFDFRSMIRGGVKKAKDVGVCTLCRAAARVLLGLHKTGVSREEFARAANIICVNARIENERVCKGVIDLNIDTFLYIFDHKKDLSAIRICSTLAQPFGCKDTTLFHKPSQWSINIAPLPKIYHKPTPQTTTEPLKILHFTDIHFDDIYKPGGNAICGEPLCCGTNQGEPTNGSAPAGYWGDYRYCDTPWHAVQDVMTQMAKQKYDVVYYTGDTINHRVWETTADSNIGNIKRVNKIIKDTFVGTPVFPILGNHEPSPLDVFAPNEITDPTLSTAWLFETAAEDWAAWLPNSTFSTIKKGGYYTTLIKPGWRLISLNSNIAYVWNWWLLYNDIDPFGQLQWLADTLGEAEKNNELVHIISHVPTGDDTCYKKWAHEYNKIVERFSHIISVQFNGHTHYDEFNVFYNANKEPINVAYNGGSVTTYYYMNPNFRVYHVNPENYKVMDYDEYTFNLTLANQRGEDAPEWYKLYSFKEAWGVSDMTNLTQIDGVVRKIAADKNNFDQYWRFHVREGEPYMKEGCNRDCQEEKLCKLGTTEFKVDTVCKDILDNSFLNPKRRG